MGVGRGGRGWRGVVVIVVIVVQLSRTSFNWHKLNSRTRGRKATALREAWGWDRGRNCGTGTDRGIWRGERGRGAITMGVTFIREEGGDGGHDWEGKRRGNHRSNGAAIELKRDKV